MSFLYLPESFAWSHQTAKSSPPYSGILKEFYWLTIWNIAELLQESTILIWLENVERHGKKRDEESCDAECCFIRTMHLLTRYHKHWLLSETQALNCSATHRIRQIWPRFGPQWLYFFPKPNEFMKGRKFADDDDVICTASDWLEDQDQEFFYNGIRALENHWTKCISVEENDVEKWQNIMLIFCCYLYQATNFLNAPRIVTL